jgi:streptogramin lyase
MPPSGANSRFETRGPAPAAWVSLLALLIFIALLIPGTAAAGAVVHFPLPAGSEPEGIATGPEGNLWFAERGSNKIGRLTPSGQLTEFAVPTADSKPFQIAAGPDGNLWFTESATGAIGRITPTGEVTEFPVCYYCRPWGIVAGPDGNLWFTLPGAGEVGRISPAGEITRFSLGGIVGRQIALGPDGNLWAAGVAMVREEPGFGVIDRITPAGEVTAFRIPTPVEAVLPVAIASGPGGALWFAGGSAVVGRIDTDGAISELHPPLNGEHHSAAMGPDGNLWLTSSGPSPRQGSIDRLTPDGHLTAFPVPYGSRGITVGKEGNIWFTGWVGHGIGRIVPGSPGVEIRSHRVAMRPQRTRVALFCSGGSSGTACSGTIILRARLHRGSSTATVRFGAGPYRLGNDQGASPTVRLNHRKLRWLSRHRTFRLEAVVRATQGEGAIRDLELSGHFRR